MTNTYIINSKRELEQWAMNWREDREFILTVIDKEDDA